MKTLTVTWSTSLLPVVLTLMMAQPACDGAGGSGDSDADADIPTYEGQLAGMDEGYELAVDGRHVYWSETGHAILKRVPVGSGDVEEIINGAINGSPGALAVDDDHLYIATEFDPDQLMLRYDKENGQLDTFEVGCENLAASDSYIFCGASGHTDGRRFSKADLEHEAFALNGLDLSSAELAAGGDLFAAGEGQLVVVVGQDLESLTEHDIAPWTLTALAVGGGSAWAGAVDFGTDEVVILGFQGGEVQVVQNVDTVVTQIVSSLAVDATHIYYGVTSSFSSGDNEYYYDGRVERVPASGGSPELYSSGCYPVRVVVDDGAVYWSQVVKGATSGDDVWTLHRSLK